jgi:hypothetical protein
MRFCVLLALALAACGNSSAPRKDGGGGGPMPDLSTNHNGNDGGTNNNGDGGAGSSLDMTMSGGGLVDCRDANARANDPHCGGIASAVLGKGLKPSMQGPFGADIGGGFVDGNRLLLAVNISIGMPNTYGVVLAVDLMSGDRTVVSGKYSDPSTGDQTVGTGPALAGCNDVQKAPDGSYWASVSADQGTGSSPRYLMKIDATSGNRTQLWTDGGNGIQCTNTSVKYVVDAGSIAVGADGSAYYAFAANPQPAGYGIIKLNPKGNSCTLVTAVQATNAGDNRGTGPNNFNEVKSLRLDASGSLWAVDGETNTLWKVDVATGNRARVSSNDASHLVGNGSLDVGASGLALGVQASDKIWTVGTYVSGGGGGALTAIDPTTGDRSGPTAADVAGPVNLESNGIWHYPGKSWLILSSQSFAVVVFDPQNNNSNYLSKD